MLASVSPRAYRFAVRMFMMVSISSLCACGAPDAASQDPHGIGTVCDGNAQCSSDLFCNTDPVIAAPHGQCTYACGESTSSCIQKAGASAVCTDAGVCVLTCRIDADCPAQTGCSADGYCDRAVVRAAADAHCVGSPKGCAAVDSAGENCEDAPGCTLVDRCMGTATSCEAQDVDLCGFSGCYFHPHTGRCGGTPNSCASAPGELSCFDRAGCTFGPLCVGTPQPCEELRPSQCTLQPGCKLE